EAHRNLRSFIIELSERSGGEGEEICADWFGLAEMPEAVRSAARDSVRARIGDGSPRRHRRKIQLKSSLQIRLVEAWKRRARIRRHEKRVDVFGLVFAIHVARDGAARSRDGRFKLELDDVLAFDQIRARNLDVVVGLA